MRLHALIFAAGRGVPLVGTVYDPKVSGFLEYIGQKHFLDFSAVTGEALCHLLDAALSGGGVEPGERIEEALRREIREERGEKLQLSQITPWTFSDDIRVKTYADGRREEIYMIYLIFDCISANRDVTINEEFQDYAWVKAEDLPHYDLNVATRKTLTLKGLL